MRFSQTLQIFVFFRRNYLTLHLKSFTICAKGKNPQAVPPVREAAASRTLFFLAKKGKEDNLITCRYFTYEDRKKLEDLYNTGSALPNIADTLGVHLATIYRELNRGSTGEIDANGRAGYDAELAQKNMLESLKRRGRKQGGDKQNE